MDDRPYQAIDIVPNSAKNAAALLLKLINQSAQCRLEQALRTGRFGMAVALTVRQLKR